MSRSAHWVVRAALLLGTVTFGADASAAGCTGQYKFISNDRLSVQEYSRIEATVRKDGANSTVLVAGIADYEDTAARGSWELWGVVYGASSDLGEEVIGGTLWVKHREGFGTGGGGTFRVAKDGVRLAIVPEEPTDGCKAGFTFRLDPQGRLFANGKLVGRTKDAFER